jgi:predicted DNA-binding antitoxin AbrB/MazE fold protein
MERVVEAVYENGVLTPLEPLNLPEHLRVQITIQIPSTRTPEDVLQGWRSVYEGLSEEDISEIERIALDRSRFMRQGT